MIKTILVIGVLFAGCGPLLAQSLVPEAAVDPEPALRLAFFKSIADDDDATFSRMLDQGMTPDAELIEPPPDEFVRTFPDERLRYFLSSEQGFTALMLASALGNEIFVRKLLAAGASPNKVTKRHKTFALWLAGKYARIEIMRLLMGIGPYDPARGLFLSVNLDSQRARLFREGEVVAEMPISSGRSSHPTPRGWFVVTDKYESWVSTIYRAKMPYFLRLSCSDFGLHAGALPGYPASSGCIRLPAAEAKRLFPLVARGTLVGIE